MEIYWAGISNKLAITLSQIDSPPACVYSYCTATTTAAVRGGVASGGQRYGRRSTALLCGSLPTIRSRKQASTARLWVTLMVQFPSISEDYMGIYKIRLLYCVLISKCQCCCLLFSRFAALLLLYLNKIKTHKTCYNCTGKSMMSWLYVISAVSGPAGVGKQFNCCETMAFHRMVVGLYYVMFPIDITVVHDHVC